MTEQDRIREKLIEYIDGRLPEAEKTEIDRWLDENPAGREEYRQLKSLLQRLEEDVPEVPSGKLIRRYEDWLDGYQSQERPESKPLFFSTWFKIAASFVLLILAGGGGYLIKSTLDQKTELARLQRELAETKQLVLSQLRDEQSASQRMMGVYAANELSTPDEEIISVLAKAMEEDPSSNVRLAALEALSRFYQDERVRTLLIGSLNRQTDPVVQIALIQWLVQMKEKSILQDLEKITRGNSPVKAVKDEAYKGIFKLT